MSLDNNFQFGQTHRESPRTVGAKWTDAPNHTKPIRQNQQARLLDFKKEQQAPAPHLLSTTSSQVICISRTEPGYNMPSDPRPMILRELVATAGLQKEQHSAFPQLAVDRKYPNHFYWPTRTWLRNIG